MTRRTVAIGTTFVGLLWSLCVWTQPASLAEAEASSPPKGFTFALTGKGAPGRWQVVADETAQNGHALAQTDADRTDYRFPLAIYDEIVAADVEITVHFKAVSGKIDQAAGVVVRFADANNYYVARANALEDNVRFYRVVKGDRQQIASTSVKVSSGQWHDLALRAQGNSFTVTYDGKPVLTAKDSTFTAAGKTGLWTKADSVSYFDRIEINALR